MINHLFPSIPVPLIQIALGSAITLVSPHFNFYLEPELFFVLFIAPLLYNDGKHTPRGELWRLRTPIFLLAVGLVFATVFVVGYCIHWMIPSMPLPVAFGLAAILSPTDAVAVGALAGRIRLPKSLLHLLEGEGLMNDASGLVAFKFAIAAAVTGIFSLANATMSFLVIFIGGLLAGAVTAVVITGIRSLLRRSGLENETLHTLIHILTPFTLFLIAEELGLSGILAAVAGGVVHAIERDHSHKIKSRPDESADHTWSIIAYLLNGLVFIVLGVQLPDVFSVVFESADFNNFVVIGYAVAIYILLILLRFVWVFAYSRMKNPNQTKVSLKLLTMTSLSGVRGAVTLAGAMTIPLTIASGDPFPERSLTIFLAACVIVLSLLSASIFLPLLARNKTEDGEEDMAKQEHEGQLRMMRSAILAVRHATTEENEGEAALVITQYHRWIRHAQFDKRKCRKTGLRIKAIEIERDVICQLLDSGVISERHASLSLWNLSEIEQIESGRVQPWLIVLRRLIKSIVGYISGKKFLISASDWEELRNIKLRTCDAVIETFESIGSASPESEAADVIHHYRFIREQLSAPYQASRGNKQTKRDLQWIAIQAERNEVQLLYERNQISREVANALRRNIRARETAILE
ncbi:Na+/H+ antiporter [Paenibacillus konkukensis]|uniref:Na+/H+ antiporter n=1 Tax=Paenibacillus konkukensis TaxID=2020716 RepID=UPI00201D68CB|nr:Na+/H+ antiporter [Paenibacillus konkukensis]